MLPGSPSAQIGPGKGSWLSRAAGGQDGGPGAALVAAAERDATAWYADNRDIYQLGGKADYNAARKLVVGSGAGSNAAGYTALENDLTGAIGADRAVFQSGASQGADALDPLAAVVITSVFRCAQFRKFMFQPGSGWARRANMRALQVRATKAGFSWHRARRIMQPDGRRASSRRRS